MIYSIPYNFAIDYRMSKNKVNIEIPPAIFHLYIFLMSVHSLLTSFFYNVKDK